MKDETDVDELLAKAKNARGVTPEQTAQIKSLLLQDLRPVRALMPAGVFVLVFLLIFVALVAMSTRFLNPLGAEQMMPIQRAVMFLALAASAALMAFTLARQMSPGTRSLPPLMLVIGILVSLLLVVLGLFQVRTETHFLSNGERCLQAGFPFAIPAGILFSLLLRKGALLSPTSTGALTGVFAGLVSMTALEVHCPNQDMWHILVFHFGFMVAGALLGAGFARLGVTFGNTKRNSS